MNTYTYSILTLNLAYTLCPLFDNINFDKQSILFQIAIGHTPIDSYLLSLPFGLHIITY